MSSKKMKPQLSKGILDMKFMQRTKAKVIKEREVEEGLALYSNEINDEMLNSSSNFITEPSFMNCEGLIEGRFSFRGMNPEIERLLELERIEKEGSQVHEQHKEITDMAMASSYYANKAPLLSQTIHKKFQRKNDLKRKSCNSEVHGINKNKRGKFLKPRYDHDD